jgi:AcrR family transcriptional regulator
MKPEERKAEIIQAARYLFLTKGYEQVSMQDVMDALGIAKGTIYYYFKSKEDLFEAVTFDLVDRVTAAMKEVAQSSTGSALERLQQLLMAGQVAASNGQILEHLHTSANQTMHLRMLAVAIQQQAPIYAEIIEQGCREGICNCAHPLECAEFILWSAQALTDQGFYPWSEEDLLRRMNAFPSIIESILHSPAGSLDFMRQMIK